MLMKLTQDGNYLTRVYRTSAAELPNSKRTIELRNDGNCCWTVYESQKFRGQSDTILVGESWIPTFDPKSLAVNNC